MPSTTREEFLVTRADICIEFILILTISNGYNIYNMSF